MPSNTLTITAQSITNDGASHVVGGPLTFTAITPVNILAGQILGGSSFTLNTDTAPSTYPTSGTLVVNTVDQFGNGYQSQVTYKGVSGSSFTGCSGGIGTTVSGSAIPYYTGTVTINWTGSGNHPWMATLTSASTLTVIIQSSVDGGTTWGDEARATWSGGPLFNKTGTQLTSDTLNVGPVNPAINAVRMLCIATGPSPIEISGQGAVATA